MLRLAIPAALLAASALAGVEAPPDFQKDVRPIFAKYCFGCHATGVKMGSFECDNYDAILRGASHGPVIVAGDSAKSRLYMALTGKLSPAMPMSNERLTTGELDIVRKWIDAGAKPPSTPNTTAAAKPAPGEANLGLKPQSTQKPPIYSMTIQSGRIAMGAYQSVNTGSLKDVAKLTGPSDAVRAVAYSRDAKLLAAAGGRPGVKGEAIIWDVTATPPKEITRITGHSDCIYAIAFAPDAKTIATAGYDKLIKLWDVATGKEVRTLKDHIDAIYALAFTPDGKRLISGSADRTIKIWNPETGERLYTLSEPTDAINSIALDPTGKFVVAGGADKNIRVWQLGDKAGTLVSTLIAHQDAVLKVTWSADGKHIASASADRTIKIYSAPDLTEIRMIPGLREWVSGLEFQDGAIVFTQLDGSITTLREVTVQ